MAERKIAKFVGHSGTERVLTKADQASIVGTDLFKAEKDLVWPKGNSQLDVTDVHEDVLEYLAKTDDEFTVKSVTVPDEAPVLVDESEQKTPESDAPAVADVEAPVAQTGRTGRGSSTS